MKQVLKLDKSEADTVDINPNSISEDVQVYFKSPVIRIDEIKAGTCNRLFRFDLDDGRSLLVKFYFVDERQRLTREFDALTFLQLNTFGNVPKAYYEDESKGYAVYSFEPGRTKLPEELTRSDLTKMMDFLVKLHSYRPEEVSARFPKAVFACFSFQDYIKNIEYRSKQFSIALESSQLSPRTSQFAREHDLINLVGSFVEQATEGLSTKDIQSPLNSDLRRLSMVDFGPHNTLFSEDEPCFVDLEYFGWDDPMRDIASFAEHDQLRKLPIGDRVFALDYYRDHVQLPEESLNRLPIVLRLVAIEWIGIHMLALTPKKIDLRKFGNPDFDQETYEKDQLSKIERRIDAVTRQLLTR
jgi:thiamine kinase-like enzyme